MGSNPERRSFLRLPHRPLIRAERDVDEELRFHLQARADELIAAGTDPEDALARARAEFGDVEGMRSACRAATVRRERRGRVLEWFREVRRDLRFALRTLLRRPIFSLAAVGSLALGIGANAAIFFAVNAFFLSPLRLHEADRLVIVSGMDLEMQFDGLYLSWDEHLALHTGSRTFDLAAWRAKDFSLLDSGEPIRARACCVSWNFPRVLGVQPRLGRLFSAADAEADAPAVILLSHSFWWARYGGDPDIVGRTIRLNDAPCTVIGVLPSGIEFPYHLDLYSLLRPAEIAQLEQRFVRLLGRLESGTAIAAAQAELDALMAGRQAAGGPAVDQAIGVSVEPVSAFLFAGARTPVAVLYLFVSLILLLACANVANLLLVRGIHRRQEIAIRISLGAGRGRIVRQLVTESLLLAGVGGVLGIGLGMIGRDLMWGIFPLNYPPVLDLSLNLRAALALVGIVVLSGLVAGLWPAFMTARRDIQTVLRAAARSLAGDRGQRRLQTLLTVFQITAALTVLVGAGMLFGEVNRLRSFDPGYDPRNLLVGHLEIEPAETMPPPDRLRFIDEVVARLQRAPGVVAASAAAALPIRELIKVASMAPGGVEGGAGAVEYHRYNVVRSDYFETMRIPLLRGRGFSPGDDRAGTAPVAIVNETFAERYWPEDDPLGKTVRFPGTGGEPEVVTEVVGVVGTTEWIPPRGVREVVYRPYAQDPDPKITFIVRTGSDPVDLTGLLKEAVWASAPELPFHWIRTVEDLIEQDNWDTMTFYPWIFAILSVTGLVMACLGVYGVVAFTATQRTREFGIRLAMGASPGALLSLAMRQGVRLAALGLIVGLPAAVLFMRITASLVRAAASFSLPVLAAASVLLAGAVLLAGYLPAARSIRLDPVEVLRQE